jgi:hypothetical protein
MQVEGYVSYLHEKPGRGKNGKPYKLYSVKLIDQETGEEGDTWYGFGFDKPPFKDDKTTEGNGDYVRFEVTEDQYGLKYVEGSGSIVRKNTPARPKKADAKAAVAPAGGKKAVTSELFGDIGGYNTEDDIRRMSFSNARGDAIKTVEMLLANDALVTSSAKTKGGQAKRFEELLAAVDKLTVKFFFDSASGRLLNTVADTVAAPQAQGELPDDSDESDDSNDPDSEQVDDGPPEDMDKF